MLAAPLAARAQPASRKARVGWLGWTGGGDAAPGIPLEALREGLAGRGWHEGKNLAIEVRAGDRDRARELTAELLRAHVDLIVAQGPMVFAARAVAGSTPIVFGINGDPVEAKLVASMARPGGNLTGITALSAELAGKRLELVRETLPRVVRVAAVANETHPGVGTEYQASHVAAQRLGLQLIWLPIAPARGLDDALSAIVRERAEAVVAIPDTLINGHAPAIAAFAGGRRLFTISGWSEFVEAGNVMSYGPSLRGYFRHTAAYVDKLLRGARPAELPIEQPTEFELVINLKAATAAGVAIPSAVRLRADRVIE
jgi:putative ABC transport system substrate-binding protein